MRREEELRQEETRRLAEERENAERQRLELAKRQEEERRRLEEEKRITEERLKAYHEKKSKKAAVIAKTSVLLDVKVGIYIKHHGSEPRGKLCVCSPGTTRRTWTRCWRT